MLVFSNIMSNAPANMIGEKLAKKLPIVMTQLYNILPHIKTRLLLASFSLLRAHPGRV
jgi:hypothetical protein